MKFKANRPKNMALNIKKISAVLKHDFPSAIDAIKLLKRHKKLKHLLKN